MDFVIIIEKINSPINNYFCYGAADGVSDVINLSLRLFSIIKSEK